MLFDQLFCWPWPNVGCSVDSQQWLCHDSVASSLIESEIPTPLRRQWEPCSHLTHAQQKLPMATLFLSGFLKAIGAGFSPCSAWMYGCVGTRLRQHMLLNPLSGCSQTGLMFPPHGDREPRQPWLTPMMTMGCAPPSVDIREYTSARTTKGKYPPLLPPVVSVQLINTH